MTEVELLCGAASAVITPPLGTSLAGYFTDRKAVAFMDDLLASACVFRTGKDAVVLVACDLIEFPETLAASIRTAIASKVGLPVCSVILTATHTHTGPELEEPRAEQACLQDLSDRIVAVAATAHSNLRPCRLAYGSGIDTRFAFNRRYRMADGSVMTNPGANNLDVVAPAGRVDHSVDVIEISDAIGSLVALVVTCANHVDTMAIDEVSADWPGYLRQIVADKVGEIPVLVLNGASGDVNHFDVMHNRVAQGPDEARRIGQGYGETVLRILADAQPLPVGQARVLCESTPVPYRHISEEELAEARATVDALSADPEARLVGRLESQDIARGNKAVKLMFARSIVQAAERPQGRAKTLLVTVLRLGDVGIIGVNGELFADIGLTLKRQSPFRHTLVAELANGGIGYLGTKAAYAQGGYESMHGNRVCDEVER